MYDLIVMTDYVNSTKYALSFTALTLKAKDMFLEIGGMYKIVKEWNLSSINVQIALAPIEVFLLICYIYF